MCISGTDLQGDKANQKQSPYSVALYTMHSEKQLMGKFHGIFTNKECFICCGAAIDVRV